LIEKSTGIVDIAVKSINLIFGIFVTFLMSFRGPYNIVPADLDEEEIERNRPLSCCNSKRCCFCFSVD